MSVLSPAFQFYPKDFLSDFNVRAMTFEQRGIYIELLCYCWLENGIPKTQIEGWFKGGSSVLEPVLKCFYERDERYFHKRLDQEREKQEYWRKKSHDGGIKSAITRREHPVKRHRKRTYETLNHPMNQTSTKGQPKVNHSVSSSSSSSSSSIGDINPIDITLTQLLIDLMLQNNPKSKAARMSKEQQARWINECRVMRQRHGRTPEEIEKVIRFSQQDKFWMQNILSMRKVSEKFDTLWLRASGTGGQTKLAGIGEWLKEQENK